MAVVNSRRLNALSCCLAFLVLATRSCDIDTVAFADEAPALRSTTAERLLSIEQRIGSSNGSAIAFESEYLTLAKQTVDPREMGAIYASLVTMYGRHGLPWPDKAVFYAKTALKYPLERRTAIDVYIVATSALLVQYDNHAADARESLRIDVVTMALQALALLTDIGPGEKPKPLPVIGRFECDDESPTCNEMRDAHYRLVARRAHVVSYNHTIRQRDTLVRQCADALRDVPGSEASSMLSSIATSLRLEPDYVHGIVQAVGAAVIRR